MAEPMRQISPKDPGSLERLDPGISTVSGDCWKWGSWLVLMGKLSVLFWHVLWSFLEDLMICCNSMFLGYLMSIWSYVTMMAHETYTEPCKDCLLKTIFKFRLTLVFDGKDSLALEHPHSVKALHESCSTVFGKLPFCLELPILLCFFFTATLQHSKVSVQHL